MPTVPPQANLVPEFRYRIGPIDAYGAVKEIAAGLRAAEIDPAIV